jgi:hypothetical protein
MTTVQRPVTPAGGAPGADRLKWLSGLRTLLGAGLHLGGCRHAAPTGWLPAVLVAVAGHSMPGHMEVRGPGGAKANGARGPRRTTATVLDDLMPTFAITCRG